MLEGAKVAIKKQSAIREGTRDEDAVGSMKDREDMRTTHTMSGWTI
jgi:hypothetical protein